MVPAHATSLIKTVYSGYLGDESGEGVLVAEGVGVGCGGAACVGVESGEFVVVEVAVENDSCVAWLVGTVRELVGV